MADPFQNPVQTQMSVRRGWEGPWTAYALANAAQGGASLLLPLFIAAALGGSPGEVGLTTGLASLAGVLGGLVWGRWSDRFGQRKPFAVLGFAAVGLGLWLLGLSGSLAQLIAVNAGLTFFWLAGSAVSVPLAVEGRSRGDWARRIARLNLYAAVGWTGGLLLGALWMRAFVEPHDGVGAMRALFGLLGALALGAALVAWRAIVEPAPQAPDTDTTVRRFRGVLPAVGLAWERFRFAPLSLFHGLPGPRELWAVMRGRRRNGFGFPLTRFLQSVAFYHTGFAALWVPLPLFLYEELGLNPSLLFALFILHQGTSALMNPYVARLAERVRARHLHRAGLLIRALLALMLGLLPVVREHGGLLVGLLALFFALTGMSWSLVNVSATAMIAKRIRVGQRGRAIGAYNAAMGLGGILGALWGGALADRSYLGAFAFSAALVLGGLLLIQRLPRARRERGRTRGRRGAVTLPALPREGGWTGHEAP